MTFGIEEIIHNSKKARRKCDKISNKKPKKEKSRKRKKRKSERRQAVSPMRPLNFFLNFDEKQTFAADD